MKRTSVTNRILQVRFYQLLQQCLIEHSDRCIDGKWEAFELEFPGLLEFIKNNESFPESFDNQSSIELFKYFYNCCEHMDYHSLYDSSLNLEDNFSFGGVDLSVLSPSMPLYAFPILYDDISPTHRKSLTGRPPGKGFKAVTSKGGNP